eukprot:Clim_evm2s202 gene=Clim_evmTU2s202
MKPFIAIAIGTVIGMTTASPITPSVADTCVPADGECVTGADCCDFMPCNMNQGDKGYCWNLVNNLRRMNADCTNDDQCFTGLCQNNHCAPNNAPGEDGDECVFDFECKGGWCKASETPGARATCADRSGHPTDPAQWHTTDPTVE